MSKGSRRKKAVEARIDTRNEKRYGCGFTHADLDLAVTVTGLSRTDAEKALKDSFRKAKAGGDPVNVFERLSLKKGPRGQTARLIVQ